MIIITTIAARIAMRACIGGIRTLGARSTSASTPRGASAATTRARRMGGCTRYVQRGGVLPAIARLPLPEHLEAEVDDASDQLSVRDAGKFPQPREHADRR